ncbi:MAG: chorismate-binding protein [Spirochaetia bacterium]|nr:chorismate-binding protein [Spirochaetia bacterium]
MNELQYKKLRADRITPQVAFLKLSACALLESAVLDIGKSRYSILMVSESSRIQLDSRGVVCTAPDGLERIIDSSPEKFLEYVKEYSRKSVDFPEAVHLSFPVPAGGVGYLGYETAALMDEIHLADQHDDLQLPDSVFVFGRVFVVFDHYKDELIILALKREGENYNLKKEIQKIEDRLFDADFRAFQGDETEYAADADTDKHAEVYITGVKKVREAVIRGDLLQGVLSHRVAVKSGIPPFEAYRRLRRTNPSPYMFFLDFSGFILYGASPEVMIKFTEGVATIKPIAGTRPRGKTRKEDLRLEQELLHDPKERAEHLMLIDLARNDLNRVCKPGTVQVSKSFSVERYSHVMHIVSEVEGELDDEKDVFDLIRASFPAGTVSGAPKIKAMEIISALEPVKRGPYAGLIGYIDIHNDFDSCIIIRSVICKEGTFYVQAGAGIVYDSIPEKEYEETVNKAKATIQTLGGLS